MQMFFCRFSYASHTLNGTVMGHVMHICDEVKNYRNLSRAPNTLSSAAGKSINVCIIHNAVAHHTGCICRSVSCALKAERCGVVKRKMVKIKKN